MLTDSHIKWVRGPELDTISVKTLHTSVLCHPTFPLFTIIQLHCHLSISKYTKFISTLELLFSLFPFPEMHYLPSDLSLNVTSSERPFVTRFQPLLLSYFCCYHSNLFISSCDIIRIVSICLLSALFSII